MEQDQDFEHQEFTAARQAAAPSAAEHWEVTYLDTECGRIRTEAFDDAAGAERFASRRIQDEHGWAVIDAVLPRQGRAAA